MKFARKPLSGLIALGAALAMPVAFAQDATGADPATQHAPPTEAHAADSSQPLTWADLDVDGNGTLSRQEAGSLQSLALAFDEADADNDGQLTPDEYKAYVAKVNAEDRPEASGGID